MHIIDTHAHIFSDRIASAAVKATNVFYDGCCNEEIPVPIHLGHLPGTVDDLLDRCRRSGVDRAVVFCKEDVGHQASSRDLCAAAASVFALLMTWKFASFTTEKIGGVTGDIYGAVTTLAEMFALITFLLIGNYLR